jgi:hypothetical protein
MAIQIAFATIYAHSPDEENLRPTVPTHPLFFLDKRLAFVYSLS